MKVAVLSACYGGYDHVDPVPEQDVDAEWIMVTDNPKLNAPGWNVIVEPRSHMHPRLAAKVPKCDPWEYTDAYQTVWMDASCRLLVPDALNQLLHACGSHYQAQIVHPWRHDIVDEALASEGMPKYANQAVRDQAAYYVEQGHPPGWGLWATGLIVRNNVREIDMSAVGREWLAEQVRWTYQDQISQPVVLRRHNMAIKSLPFDLHGSGVFEWHNHVSEL